MCVHFTSTKHRVLFVFHTGENKIKYIVLVQYNQYGVEYSAVDILFLEYLPHSHSKVTFHASPLASIIFLIVSKYLVLKVWLDLQTFCFAQTDGIVVMLVDMSVCKHVTAYVKGGNPEIQKEHFPKVS